ncbi:hypothetical protein FC32_GL001855 [Ligilactobacillus apodemi DSM 16634 = JCM 16172]|uniref:Integral membrane protein n=1 Tax=Ligilactobacillus apodemi DSM 16634 = JCM 16172 TaxID=1423724 RepID=A0A0R1U206_9LACO|nr:TIGR03766 family XrtG-associated glycosyltransferase [Ligilactobacillus apodemi]KRL86580.1 hypothetical protein FC32_GL001855 [Ligilactobacillus apodemi DSM 16634 = JCM 16172]MCR1901721.1 hypothetical protein [Ligilactobacillus apodemi]
MKNWLFNKTNKFFNGLYAFFMLLTLYFVIISANFTLGDTVTKKTLGTRTTKVTVIFLAFMLTLGLTLWGSPRSRQFLQKIFFKAACITVPFCLLLVCSWQIFFILTVHPAIGFDPQALHTALRDPSASELRGYFSLNQNNLFLLLVMHKLSVIFGTDSWVFFDFVSLILTDLSVLFNLTTLALIARKKVALGAYLQILWLALFPMIIVPYSDTWVLPFVSCFILCYVASFHSKLPTYLKLGAAISGGLCVGVIYFIKPSAIIPVIAVFLVEGLFLLCQKPTSWLTFSLGVLFLLGGIANSFIMLDHKLNTQTYIKIQASRALPPLHFISIGMTGDGGYDANEALIMAKLPTKTQKEAYAKKNIARQLKQKGFWGYLKFLFFKHQRNTSDGTFAWQQEGNFFTTKKPTNSNFLAEAVYAQGKYSADFRYIAQCWWLLIILLLGLGCHFKQTDPIVQMLKLTLIGGFLYLLLFEGGRSRYMIQFLPSLLILATLSADNAKNWLQRRFAWLK